MKTTPDVFIVQSLRFDDEEGQHSEGSFISHILRLAERRVQYYYIRMNQTGSKFSIDLKPVPFDICTSPVTQTETALRSPLTILTLTTSVLYSARIWRAGAFFSPRANW